MSDPVNRAGLRDMADQLGGWAVIDDLIDEYIKGARGSLGKIEDAVDAGDAEALRSAAHGLKGSSLQMNVDGVADLCRELEEAAEGGDLDGAEELVAETREAFEEAERVLEEMRQEEVPG